MEMVSPAAEGRRNYRSIDPLLMNRNTVRLTHGYSASGANRASHSYRDGPYSPVAPFLYVIGVRETILQHALLRG